MAPPVIPDKPLRCYPSDQDRPEIGAGTNSDPKQCTTEGVLKDYEAEGKNYTRQCGDRPYNACKTDGIDADADQARLCLEGYYSKESCEKMGIHDPQQAYQCLQKVASCEKQTDGFAVTASRLGALDPRSPLKAIVPHLDKNSIEDFRSAGVMLDAARSPELTSLVKEKREINVVYPGSGSHMTPVAIVMDQVDQGNIDRANLTYTEVDPKAGDRIHEYLRWMAAPERKMIGDLKVETHPLVKGQRTDYSFTYKGKPIHLNFECGTGGKFWARDEVLQKSDLVILHDSMTNNPIKKDDHQVDDLVQYLQKISNKDHQPRILLGENEWAKNCDKDKVCKINGQEYASKPLEGPYGCGKMSFKVPTLVVKDGRLVEDTHSILQKGNGLHIEPHHYGDNQNTLLLSINPSP